MHRIVAICLLMLYVSSLLPFIMPYASYVLNYSYIVNNLCVNRNKPEMHCNGHCVLMQMIERQERDAERAAEKLTPSNRLLETFHLPSSSVFQKGLLSPFHCVTAANPLSPTSPSLEPLFHPPLA